MGKHLSFSAVSTFEQCPYKYKLRYIDSLEMLDDYEPADALKLGTALHRGIEVDAQTAIKEYYMSYPVITDQHINEAMKLEVMIKKAREVLPLDGALHEVFVHEKSVYKGYIDMLAPTDEDNVYDMYDFKYSNNIEHYMESPQLSIYKYYAEKILGIKIRKMYFVFVGKTMIRQKKTEDLMQFRQRLRSTLKDLEVQIKEVEYKPSQVRDFIKSQIDIIFCEDYIKGQSKLCDWCEYQHYCEEREVLDMLPSTIRVAVEATSKKKLWIYGAPFSGKTTFADGAPTPLNLNTDGNVKYVTMPRLAIKDEVTVEGRLTKRKFAWEIFKEAIDDLEKGSEFETIVVDLLEDTYEHCRLYMYDQLNISHESDDSFRAWDKVRTEYLSTIKRLLNLDYNIILLSHEDSSKDLTKKGGDKITAIMPNLNEKASKKIAGMVDLVARLVVDGDKRTLNFKSDEVVFGGGRLKGVKTTEIPLDWDALCDVYDEAIGEVADATPKIEEKSHTPNNREKFEPIENGELLEPKEKLEEDKPVRRTRRKRGE